MTESASFWDISDRIMLIVSNPCSRWLLVNILIRKLKSVSTELFFFFFCIFLFHQKLVISIDITRKLPVSFKNFKNFIITILGEFMCNTKSFTTAILVFFFLLLSFPLVFLDELPEVLLMNCYPESVRIGSHLFD